MVSKPTPRGQEAPRNHAPARTVVFIPERDCISSTRPADARHRFRLEERRKDELMVMVEILLEVQHWSEADRQALADSMFADRLPPHTCGSQRDKERQLAFAPEMRIQRLIVGNLISMSFTNLIGWLVTLNRANKSGNITRFMRDAMIDRDIKLDARRDNELWESAKGGWR